MNVLRSLVSVAYGLVFLAFLPLAVSGEIGLVLPAAFLAAMIASLLRDPHVGPARPLTARVWTGTLLAAFAGLIAWSTQDGQWLVHAITFALLMTASRFFQRRYAKDYLQLTALSFILLLVSAVVYPGPTFALCFLGYTVLTMWGLTLQHVASEIEWQTRTGPPSPPQGIKRRWFGLLRPRTIAPDLPQWPELPMTEGLLSWRTRRLITARWFAATSALALFLLVISALFFFLFPRLGMGFFFAQTRGAQNVVGFGTDAELGHFGQLKTSAQVVARVSFDDPRRLELPIRLRGISFQNFVGNGWTRPEERSDDLTHEAGRYAVPTTATANPYRERVWRAEIYLEPLAQENYVLFAPPRTQAVELLDVRFDYLRRDVGSWKGKRRRVSLTPSGDLSYRAPPDTAMHYAVEVVEPMDAAAQERALREADAHLPKRIAGRWTVLPADLDPRIPELAKKLANQASNRLDQARAVEAALRTGWTYSLAGDQDADKPLADFLFGKKSGHCEYFATAMTLMMRSLGHAARPVHGFSGGQLNEYGKYRMIRQADAHAWVEVFFPGLGWRTFDPTPASGQLAPPDQGAAAWLRQIADQATLVWYQWVVEYDLERQIEVFKSLTSAFKGLKGPGKSNPFMTGADSPAGKVAPPQPSTGLPWPALILAALAVLGGLWWLRRRQDHGHALDPVLAGAAHRLERSLAERGLARQPWETWSLVAARVAAIDGEAGPWLQKFATAWDRARFGPSPSPADRRTAADLATMATRTLRRKRK